MLVKSIEDVIGFLGTECRTCRSYFGNIGSYAQVQKKGGYAIFLCNRGHDHRRKIAFQTTPEDIRSLEKDIRELLRELSPETVSEFEFRDYLKKSDDLMKKIRVYAHFALENLNMQIDGYCYYCLKKVPIKIENNIVGIECSHCANVIADDAD